MVLKVGVSVATTTNIFLIVPHVFCTIVEFDSSLKLLQRKQFAMQEQQMVHDWGLTDNHYVLIANRVKLDHIGIYQIHF